MPTAPHWKNTGSLEIGSAEKKPLLELGCFGGSMLRSDNGARPYLSALGDQATRMIYCRVMGR